MNDIITQLLLFDDKFMSEMHLSIHIVPVDHLHKTKQIQKL